jgi:hypothetical protein
VDQGIDERPFPPSPSERDRTPRPFDALGASEPEDKNEPLTPTLSPSEGERRNRRQTYGESGFMGNVLFRAGEGKATQGDEEDVV